MTGTKEDDTKRAFKISIVFAIGLAITYTVKEVAIEGYESKIEGNAKDGFVITNKNLAKTEVPVEKFDLKSLL